MSNATKSNKKPTLKSLTQSLVTGAIDTFTASQSIKADIAEKNPEIKDDATRRAAYGTKGMAVHTHSKYTSLASGMSPKALKIFNEHFNYTVHQMTHIADEGGIAAYAKGYVVTICECIAQQKLHNMLDMTAINNAMKTIDPDFGNKRYGEKVVTHLIDALGSGKQEMTINYWIAEQNGRTQGNYIFKIMADNDMGVITGTRDARKIKINYDHPVIIELKKLNARFMKSDTSA
ncbi:hypothetical protein JCM19235_1284 [Vibrio maritimus]|uniref:Uncharacterized protein n=1 Tax=Vibrio maritimus TaxID=990268 RepID=A0A090S892_9VIBR|nr:hypothetical protein JCM19235_1284 [Vibrio maritimus]